MPPDAPSLLRRRGSARPIRPADGADSTAAAQHGSFTPALRRPSLGRCLTRTNVHALNCPASTPLPTRGLPWHAASSCGFDRRMPRRFLPEMPSGDSVEQRTDTRQGSRRRLQRKGLAQWSHVQIRSACRIHRRRTRRVRLYAFHPRAHAHTRARAHSHAHTHTHTQARARTRTHARTDVCARKHAPNPHAHSCTVSVRFS